MAPPAHGPRTLRLRVIDPLVGYLRERTTAYPGPTGFRFFQELHVYGDQAGYIAAIDNL